MKKTRVVSWPRSGTQLLIWTLLRYFSRDVNYPDYDGTRTNYQAFLRGEQTLNRALENLAPVGKVWFAGKVVYRDMAFNDRWQLVEATLLHTHGDNIPYQNDPNSAYLIQYRNPIPATVSLIRTWPSDALTNGPAVEAEIDAQMTKWRAWMDKWVRKNRKPNVYFLDYQTLLENFDTQLLAILRFVNAQIDKPFLADVIATAEVKPYHSLTDDPIFQRFAPQFEAWQRKLAKELHEFTIPKVTFS